MALLTPDDFIKQMVQQLRTLDPNISAVEGTPEYKIISTVASALSSSQIDVNVVNGSMDPFAKYGSNLDTFMQIFGFGRQTGLAATATVVFSRDSAANTDILIPSGTQIASSDDIRMVYETSAAVTLTANSTSVEAPIRASMVGELGNKPAGVITDFVGSPVLGIGSVINRTPAVGGLEVEGDDEYKARFKTTVFRNLSGTEDQYLATAVSGSSTKATVVGPISKHIENLQVPSVDDASLDEEAVGGNGNPGEYTTSLSSIHYSKYTYSDSFYVSNQDKSLFYSPNSDYLVNANIVAGLKNRGDTYRMAKKGTGPDVLSADAATYFYQPNITFLNITDDQDSATLSPNDIVSVEHSYISTASRNDWDRAILNCVDIFVNNERKTESDVVVSKPYDQIFNTIPGNRFYVGNFVRSGKTDVHPRAGNLYSPLLWQPVTALPETIVMGLTTYSLGIHYWLVESSDLAGTVRSRNGIEWASDVRGELSIDLNTDFYTGPNFAENEEPNISVNGYFFDENISTLQSSIEGLKPVTTDVLVHKAKTRYFKFDVTIMYNSGANIDAANSAMNRALSKTMSNAYFGTTIQLSDVLQIIHNVNGVDNVRWTNEESGLGYRVIECNADGSPVLGVQVGTQNDKVYVSLTGSPTSGEFRIIFDGGSTGVLPYNITRDALQSEVRYVYFGSTVSGSGTPTDPFIITVPHDNVSAMGEENPYNPLDGGPYLINVDFGLRDDELPALPDRMIDGDTVPGLIVTKRVQSNWNK
jgi:uncharacterized phage protein gp47/JayE